MRRQAAIAVLTFTLATGGARAGDDALEAGKAEFMAHCASCHGEDAKGDGPHAVVLAKKPADLTEITARYGSFPAERVFETIAGLDDSGAHGTREMPIWGDVFVSEAVGKSVKLEDAMKASDEATRRIVNLVTYIESIQDQP